MQKEKKIIMSNSERHRKWRAENPEKVFLAQIRRNMHLKKKRKSDMQYNLIWREKERIRKQKHRLATKAKALQQV